MIFLDTSAIYALADRNDRNHTEAKRHFERLVTAREPLLTHNYVLVESAALIQHRLGAKPAAVFLTEAERFTIQWIGDSLHTAALNYFRKQQRRRLSFVDCVSFIVMWDKGMQQAFAFDPDFQRGGFKLV